MQAFIALGGLVGVGAGIYYLVRRAVRAEILRLRDRGGPPSEPNPAFARGLRDTRMD